MKHLEPNDKKTVRLNRGILSEKSIQFFGWTSHFARTGIETSTGRNAIVSGKRYVSNGIESQIVFVSKNYR